MPSKTCGNDSELQMNRAMRRMIDGGSLWRSQWQRFSRPAGLGRR